MKKINLLDKLAASSGVLAAISLIALWVISSSMSYQDELLLEKTYCQMVKSGDYPNYNNEVKCDGQ